MSKNGLLIFIFILSVSYSCIKKQEAQRPGVTYKLNMSIDYYGSTTPTASMRPIVSVSYIKDILTVEDESDLIPVVYNDARLVQNAIEIPQKAEVTIKISPINTTDDTMISYLLGSVPENFDTKAKTYTFIMDANKSFEVKLSSVTIEMIDFNFEVVGDGSVEISSTKNASTTKYTATKSSPKTVPIIKSDFNLYTITAEAIPNADNKFSVWSGKGTGISTTLPVNDINMAGSPIIATFIPEIKYSFTFQSTGTAGTIQIVATNKTNQTYTKALGSVASGGTSTISIGELTFNDYDVKAKATAGSGQMFDKWTGNAGGNDNPITILPNMKGIIGANFVAKPTITFNFSSGANGSIYLFFLNSNNSVYSNVRVAGPNKNNQAAIIDTSLFNNYRVEARAIGIVGDPSYGIDKWNNDSGDTAEVKELTLSSPTSQSATFKTVIINYGTGTAPTKSGDDWYEIKTKEHLIFVALNNDRMGWISEKYRIMNDIDYGGAYHPPINRGFTGVMDGNNKTISNAKFGVNDTFQDTGFVSFLTSGSISNLTIDSSCIIETSVYYVGAIASQSSGIIHNSVNKADIYTYDSTIVGGIIGGSSGGTISNVYNSGNIIQFGSINNNSIYYGGAGGVLGFFSGSGSNPPPLILVNAYNTGNVNAGVIGTIYMANAYCTNVYSSGTVTFAGIAGVATSTSVINANNVYFTGSSSLLNHGFGSLSGIKTGFNGYVPNISGYHSTFNSVPGTGSVWASGPGGRPVIRGLGEGIGY